MDLPIRFPGGVLRRLEARDLVEFMRYRSDPVLARYQGWTVMNEVDSLAFLEEMNVAPLLVPGEWTQLGIADPQSGLLIGDIGLCVASDGHAAEVGVTLASAAQGRGIATEAVRASARLVFASAGVSRVLGVTDTRNIASVRMLLRAGFRHTETRETVFRGEPCTEATYVLELRDTASRSRRS